MSRLATKELKDSLMFIVSPFFNEKMDGLFLNVLDSKTNHRYMGPRLLLEYIFYRLFARDVRQTLDRLTDSFIYLCMYECMYIH